MDCANCKHALFDQMFGEYKCKVREQRVYKPAKNNVVCEWYEEGKPGLAKFDETKIK